MRNNTNTNRNRSLRPALAVCFALALIGAASSAAQPFLNLASKATGFLNEPVRITLVRKFVDTMPAEAMDLEVNFTGANGTVTQLSATNGKQTIRFERADGAELSCPRGKVKECESVSLKAGGKLTACACLPPAPVNPDKRTYSAGETSRSAVVSAKKLATHGLNHSTRLR